MIQMMQDQQDELVVLELMLNRCRRLMADVERGTVSRNDFQPWEVEILLDATDCQLEPGRRPDLLRQYQRAVEKQLETGPEALGVFGFAHQAPPQDYLRITRLPSIRQSSRSTMLIACE